MDVRHPETRRAIEQLPDALEAAARTVRKARAHRVAWQADHVGGRMTARAEAAMRADPTKVPDGKLAGTIRTLEALRAARKREYDRADLEEVEALGDELTVSSSLEAIAEARSHLIIAMHDRGEAAKSRKRAARALLDEADAALMRMRTEQKCRQVPHMARR